MCLVQTQGGRIFVLWRWCVSPRDQFQIKMILINGPCVVLGEAEKKWFD